MPRSFPIPYDEQMLESVRRMHAGSETLPDYDKYIEDHMGGRVLAFRRRLVPQILAFTDLCDLDILDFGCGTGSTTVALAERAVGSRITALDIDHASLETARLRIRLHGLSGPIEVRHIPPVRRVGDLPDQSETFDFILLNGVLEHVVPFASRASVILEVWRLLRPGGIVYISETPNALWPFDRHTTGLPFIPWLPSRVAHRLAVLAGRHTEGRDLEIRGRRGMTYCGIVRPLRRACLAYEVLNITRARNRLLPAGLPEDEKASTKRRIGAFVLERTAGRILGAFGIPSVALGPFIEHLALRKPDHGPTS